MNRGAQLSARGMTLMEVLMVVAIVGVLAALLLPARSGPIRNKGWLCMFHLRILGSTVSEFKEQEHDFPTHVPVARGGSLELAASNSPVAAYFRTIHSPYLMDPRALVCPADKEKTVVGNPQSLSGTNISYFLSLDATPTLPQALLMGDCNLLVDGKLAQPGLLRLTTNSTVEWARGRHPRYLGTRYGNILFADLHVERVITNLTARVREQGLGTNRLAIP